MKRARYSRANQSPDEDKNLNPGSVNEGDGHEHREIAKFINEKFRKRTCKRFVEDPKDSSLCCCGYPESDSHVKKADVRKSDVTKNTEESPTDAFGEMEFPSRKIAKYIRVDCNTDVNDLLDLMIKHWKMERPNLLISVTGGAQNFNMEPRFQEVFRQGLVTAAESTRAWIITGGTNAGIMKHIGEAIRRHTIKHGIKKPLVALGIATWGCVENKEDLIDKKGKDHNQQPYFKGLWPAQYKHTTTAGKKRESPLDPNHTHFILVDNGTQQQYGAEIQLRAKLESRISKLGTSTEESVSIPVVCVVLEGGPNTLQTVTKAIDAGTPAIIVAGSGRAADILAYAYSKCSEKNLKPVGLDPFKQTVIVPIFKEQLWKTVEDMIKKEFKMTNEETIKKSVDQVRSCLNKIDHMTVFRLDGGKSAKDIDITILEALLKVNRHKPIDQLRLALAWNRVDVAKSEICKDLQDFELQDLMFPAIVGNRVDFVKFFLEKDFSLGQFLTHRRILELYSHKVTSERCPKLKSSEEDPITLEKVGMLIKQLVGELFEPYYYVKSKRKHSSVNVDFPAIYPPTEALQTDDPARDLFIWSILTRNNDLAEVFWHEAKDDLALAVAAHLLLKGLLRQEPDPDDTEELKQQIIFWKEMSVGLLTECYSSDRKKTAQLLTKELHCFGETTTLKMAAQAKNKKFVAHKACQNLLTEIWTGELSDENHKLKLVLSVFCPPVAPVLLKYRGTERNQPAGATEQRSDESGDNGPGQGLENHQNLKSSQVPATKKTASAAPSQSASRSSDPSYFMKLLYFFQAPVIKFSYNCLSYFAFLMLYAIILLTDFYPTIHVKEEILIAWVITILLEEIRQIAMNDAGDFLLKLKNYITDTWNILDVITISSFIIGLILRFIPVSICAHCFYSARIILSLNFMTFFFRILQLFSIHRKLGPKLVMIGKMMIDLFYFMIIMLVFIAAYGITSHAILYPNQPLTIALVRDVLSRSWWNMFGELGLEEVSGDECNETLTSEISAETCASLDYTEYDMAQCADYKDGKCPSIDWLVPIILVIYVLITNVLMLNLLIAMFSNTFDKIKGKTNVVWKMQSYHLIRAYDSRPMLPPPLIVLEHVYLFTRYLLRRLFECCCKKDRCDEDASNISKKHRCGKDTSKFSKKNCYGKDSSNFSKKESCCCGKDTSKFSKKNCCGKDSSNFSKKESCCCGKDTSKFSKKESCCCGKDTSKFRLSLRPGEEKELLNWENVNADEYRREKASREQSSAENKAKKMNDKVAEILTTAKVQTELTSGLQDRLEILEKQMNNTTQALQWIIDNTVRERLEKTTKLHCLARETIYPKSDGKSQCYRTRVQDEYVPWEVHYTDYRPENFTDSSVRSTDFDPFRRENFNQALHQSWISGHNYSVVGGFPRNPKGRTGLRGRGTLSSWGPNYVVNVVITRWKKGEQKLLEFISIKKQAKDEQSIPEEATTYEETSRSSAVRRCFEKLFKDAESAEKLLFLREKEIFRGYLDDYRNTDNAWLETVVLNYHIEEKDDVKLVEIKIEKDINWKTIHSYIDAYGSHRLLLYRVAKDLKAAF